MNYEQFRDLVIGELGRAGLAVSELGRKELVDLRDSDRSVRLDFPDLGSDRDDVFTCWGVVEWRWDALQSARAATCEEDVLMQLLGRRDGLPETEPGEVRVDVTLSATTPWGSDLSLPEPASLQAWASAVKAALEPLLDLGAIGAADGSTRVLGCLEGPFVEAACDEGGHLRLRRLEAKAFELVAVPRQWDDPQRPPEPDVCEQLGDLASRLVNARRAWRTALEALRPHGLKPS